MFYVDKYYISIKVSTLHVLSDIFTFHNRLETIVLITLEISEIQKGWIITKVTNLAKFKSRVIFFKCLISPAK